MSLQGTVKSFNGAKAYGFISTDDKDVFCHQSDCAGAAPRVGDVVTFDIEESPSKPGSYVAKNVSGCTGVPEGPGGKGTVKGGEGTGQFQGSVKSFSEMKAWGFIVHEGSDIFFHMKDIMDGSVPDRGDVMKFDVEENPGKPGTMKATNVTGGSKGKGMGKGNFGAKGKTDYGGKGDYGGYGGKGDYGKGGYGAAPAWGMDPYGGKGAWGPYGGGDAWGKGAWGGDAWGGKGGDPWGCGGKGGGKSYGKDFGKSCKGGW